MKIEQKKMSTKHIFTFHDEYFNFAYRDKSGSGDVNISYIDMPEKFIVKIERNQWLENAGYLWVLIGLFQLGYAIYANLPLSGKGFWLIIGSVCLVWAYFSKIRCSVFRSERGNVYVIQDKKHDPIIDELNRRKRSQLLQYYGEINPKNSLENEIQKFKWLVELKAMSPQESEAKIAQAEFLLNGSLGQEVKRLN